LLDELMMRGEQFDDAFAIQLRRLLFEIHTFFSSAFVVVCQALFHQESDEMLAH
jgi:hypothetical protein